MSYKQRYQDTAVPFLQEKYTYKNVNQMPRFTKVVVNTSMKEAVQDAKLIKSAVGDMATITGQSPVVTKAKKAIANFKLRAGVPIGCMVTLRGSKMYEFMNRLFNVALPRVRDFKGVSDKGFDGRGNYTLGLTEQIIFPEINYDKVEKVFGMNITFVTTAKTNNEGRDLLEQMGMPFRKKG